MLKHGPVWLLAGLFGLAITLTCIRVLLLAGHLLMVLGVWMVGLSTLLAITWLFTRGHPPE